MKGGSNVPGSKKYLGNNKWKLIISCGCKDGAQKRRCKTIQAKTEAAAEKELALFYTLVKAEQKKIVRRNILPILGPERLKLSVADMIKIWSERYGNTLSKTTVQSNKSNIVNNIIPYIGNKEAAAIEGDDVLWLLEELRNRAKQREPDKLLTETTVYSTFKLLRSIYNKAIEWSLLITNPCEDVPVHQRPKPDDSETPFYQFDELSMFMQAVRELKDTPTNVKQKLLLFLAFQDVCRRGEMYALTWDRIDFEHNALKIEESAYYVPGEGIQTKEPKTKSSKRQLVFGEKVKELFIKHKENQEAHLKRKQLHNPENWIFVRTRGLKPGENVKILDLSSFYNWLQDFNKRNNFKHMTVHGWRHMGASYSLAKGIDIGTVRDNMGHSNLKTTSRYVHPITAAKKDAAKEMDHLVEEALNENNKKVDI